MSGERGRRLIKRSWLVRNLLKFWESFIKQIFYWKLTNLISKRSFFTFLIIISMRSPRLESTGTITVWSIWPILISCKSLRLTDATHFLIYVSNCCELETRPKNKKCFYRRRRVNETELLKLSHYRIRLTIAQSTRLDE